jgi:hypothetical protein
MAGSANSPTCGTHEIIYEARLLLLRFLVSPCGGSAAVCCAAVLSFHQCLIVLPLLYCSDSDHTQFDGDMRDPAGERKLGPALRQNDVLTVKVGLLHVCCCFALWRAALRTCQLRLGAVRTLLFLAAHSLPFPFF